MSNLERESSGGDPQDDTWKSVVGTPVDWVDMTKQDVALWAVGGFRQHIIGVLDELARRGAEAVSVEGLRSYILSIDATLQLPESAE